MADVRGATKITFDTELLMTGKLGRSRMSVVVVTPPSLQVTEPETSDSTQSQPGDPEPPTNTTAQSSPP